MVSVTGVPVAFKSWWGHQYRVGIICLPPDLNRVNVAFTEMAGITTENNMALLKN